MIAVQTNDRLYLINMEDSEFVNLVMQENMAGRSLDEQLIPLIRARSGISFNSNDMVRFARSMISEISNCFTLVGNRFDMTPVSSLDDLMFYVDENGKQYASEEAYRMEEVGIPNPVVEGQNATQRVEEVPNPVIRKSENSEGAKEVPTPTEEETHSGKDETPVPEEEEMHSGEEEAPAPKEEEMHSGEEESVPKEEEVPPLDDEKDVIEVSEEQKRAASQLDNIVRNFPNIASLPTQYLAGIRSYINTQLATFKSYSEEYLAQMSPLDRASLKTGYPVPNAFGESTDMLDSLVIFPVYTRILSKRDLAARFSPLDLANSTMLRICPIGIAEDEHMQPIVHSYVQEIKITHQDVKEAEEKVNAELKKQGKSKRSLSSKEKYDLYEEALEEILKYRKGSMVASRETKLVEDLGKYEEELRRSSKVYIPAIEEWNSYDVAAFDARRRIDQFPTPLLTQLQNINGKTEEEIQEQYAELPSEFEPLDEEIIQVVFVDLSKESIEEGKTKYGWHDMSLSSIPDSMIDNIEERDNERYLEGYYFDLESQEFLSEAEYQERCQKANGKSDERTPRIVKIKRVDSSLPSDENDDYVEVDEKFLNDFQLGFVTETEDGFVLDGYCYDLASGDLITDIELEDIRSRRKESVEEKEDEKSQEEQIPKIPNPVIETPLHLIDRKYRQAIVAKIPTVFSGGVTEEKIAKIPNYSEFVSLSEDDMSDKLRASLVPTEDGYTLDGYCFDYDQVKLITTDEYFQAISSLPKVGEEETKKEEEHVRVLVVDTSFDYLKDCSTYSDFCSKSDVGYEDKLLSDVPTEIRELLAKEGEYLAGGGYFYNRSINQFVSLSDYTEQLNEVWHKILDIRSKQKTSQTEGFKPIIDSSVTGINMGGIPLGSDTLEEKPQSSASSELVDYVREDGTYVDPTGMEWPEGKDSYELYKLLTDETYLSSEEEKGKAK